MSEPTEKRTFSGERAGTIQAGAAHLDKSSAESITSERATIEQSSVKALETSSAQLDRSSVFKMRADNAVISHSAATFVRADDARLVNCNAIFVKGAETTVEGDLKTILHLGNATGNVHMIFDRDGALRFGLGLGASLIALGALARRLFR
jgi:hypothetical protein